jgi:hypothetical protein
VRKLEFPLPRLTVSRRQSSGEPTRSRANCSEAETDRTASLLPSGGASGSRMDPWGRVARSRRYRETTSTRATRILEDSPVHPGDVSPGPASMARRPCFPPPCVLRGRGRCSPRTPSPAAIARAAKTFVGSFRSQIGQAISEPLAPETGGLSRSVADTPPRRSGSIQPGPAQIPKLILAVQRGLQDQDCSLRCS